MKNILILALLLNSYTEICAQNLDKKIDLLFNDWNKGENPGGVVSVVKKGKVIFSGSYGKANIKYHVPTSEETVFNIGSVSKQFTAMGIVKLQLEGKLSFDDDIRKYLPELQKLEQTIKVRHLLHHTSGFRSTPELFGLAGWRDGDVITTEDDYRYLCKQTSLNFNPGDQYMYSNSNYVLLAKIIENITQQPFRLWMEENIFSPLRLTHTFIDETNNNSHPKVATPYYETSENQFAVAENTSLDIGASNMYSTVSDLIKWMSNFRSPASGWENAFRLLQTTDTLNNGDFNTYAYGIFVEEFLGNKRIQHPGGVPGFLSFTEYYPDEELTIVLLCNFTSRSIQQKQLELLKLLLKDNRTIENETVELKSMPLNLKNIKDVTGDYWNINENYSRKIYFENDTLWYLRNTGKKSPLIQIDSNEFILGGVKARVFVKFIKEGKKKMIVKDGNGSPQFFEVYDSTPLTRKEKSIYTGKFYSQELEIYYEVNMKDEQLVGYHNRHGEFPITVLRRDIIDWSGMAVAKYEYDETGQITGFYVFMNRVRNVWFKKIRD